MLGGPGTHQAAAQDKQSMKTHRKGIDALRVCKGVALKITRHFLTNIQTQYRPQRATRPLALDAAINHAVAPQKLCF